MPSGGLEIAKGELENNGYVVLEKLIRPDRLAAFETTIQNFSAGELKRRGVRRAHEDALQDLMLSDERYRETLFPLLKYLKIVQLMSAEVGDLLATSGFLEAWGFESPLIWPSLRVDLPDESAYLLPMHQDFVSTKCSTSLRLWIPLRDANRRSGTIRFIPGSHRNGPLPHDKVDDCAFGRKVNEKFYQGQPEHLAQLNAGDGLLFNSMLIHGSVGGQADVLKFVLLVQIQDLSTLIYDPSGQSPSGRAFSGQSKPLAR
jgi:ectoine hydroxylase-related dioxygenase (phytanoyl-CoA dioxygenase family)